MEGHGLPALIGEGRPDLEEGKRFPLEQLSILGLDHLLLTPCVFPTVRTNMEVMGKKEIVSH